MSDITVDDALGVFGLAPGFDMESLRKAFRSLALVVHPDRGGNASLFRTVHDCYDVLASHLQRMQGGRTHQDLKRVFSSEIETLDASSRRENKFDIARFNSVFEQNAVEQFNSTGHGEWLKSATDAPKVHISSGASAEVFNRTFDSSVASPPPSQAIVVRPAETASSSALWLTEIGGDKCEDFSMHGGYDCRIAHSTERLVARSHAGDRPDPPPRFDAGAAEAQRASDLSRGLSRQELDAISAEKQREARLDAARWRHESARHNVLASAHANASRAMIGYS